MNDLFGNPILGVEPVSRRSLALKGAKRKRKETPKGYAARPGTGPPNEKCKTCRFATKSRGGKRYWWKCWLMREKWSACYATDIRLKSPACQFWQAKPPKADDHQNQLPPVRKTHANP